MHPANEQRLPGWFRVGLSTNGRYRRVDRAIRSGGLHTVCESAACPNRNECWNSGTATFLILGDRCTRSCGFCNIGRGVPAPVDRAEPDRVARAVSSLGLRYAVVTSVTRDDLADGGAGMFADTVDAIRRAVPGCPVEVLIPDLQGSGAALDLVLDSAPDVLNHNIETVPSLYDRVRPQADYRRSLRLIERAAAGGMVTKSGLMLGLGEGMEEVRSVLRDLREAGCMALTIGQYLRPSRRNIPVVRYFLPEEFSALREEALAAGFPVVSAGPLVRSSYHAATHMHHASAGAV